MGTFTYLGDRKSFKEAALEMKGGHFHEASQDKEIVNGLQGHVCLESTVFYGAGLG